MAAVRWSEEETLTTRPPGSVVRMRLQEVGEEVVGEEVDLEGDLVAVDGEGVTLGGSDGRVVDENVQARVLPYDGVGQVLDFLQTDEVGGERA